MNLSYAEILNKLLDDANLGKFVTVAGSGLALAVSLLMALALWTDISVLPADRYSKISREAHQTGARIEEGKKKLREVVVEAYQQSGKDPKQVPSDLDAAYGLARHELADMAARLEALHQRIKAAGQRSQACGTKDECERELARLGSLHDRLATQKDVVDSEVEHQKTLRNEANEAVSLQKNMEVFTNNLAAVFVFSVIVGTVISQINRLVFVLWTYDRMLKMDRRRDLRVLVAKKQVGKEDFDALVSGYYRYMEGAINMIWPILAFGIVFPQYAQARLGLVARPWLWLLISAVAAVLLFFAGFYSYKDFRKKGQELVDSAPAAAPAAGG